ncbi:MAG: N-acyl-D-amino-acid deacylase family protein [Candidatus Polarisedimenticolia bacterium]
MTDSLDLVIAGGEVVDGTGAPPFRADVGVRGDTIAMVGPAPADGGAARIDARGRTVTPGFIDLHSHSDLCLTLPLPRQAELLEGRVRQGITTELVGNCGIGCVPVTTGSRDAVGRICGFIMPDGVDWGWDSIDAYLGLLERQGVLLNVATLAAHGPLRLAVMGPAARRPTPEEQRAMDAAARRAVEEGAFGISFGLIYPPGQFAGTDELVSVARAASSAGGLAGFHQRGSSRETLLQAVREIIEVGRRSGAAVHHSHEETVGPRAWSGVEEVMRLEAEAVRDGVDLSGDVIPYTAVCTTMLALYPPWALDGGVAAFLDRLRDPRQRARMKDEVREASPVWPPWEGSGRWVMNISRECGWERIHLAHVDGAANKRYEHLTIAEIGRRRGRDPFDALSDLLLEERGIATQLIFGISGDRDDDTHLVPLLADPRLALVTDAWEIGKGFPHPGAAGAFPRVLGHYVRERKVLSFPEAIRKMTSLPAARLGLGDRGVVAPGRRADLLVIDPARVADRSTFREPRRPAEGIDAVVINGRPVVEAGRFRPSAAGRVLRRGAA